MRSLSFIVLCLLLVVGMTQAAITVDPSGGDETDFKTWIISDLTSDPQTFEGINTGGSSTGVIAGLGLVTDSETFSVTLDAVYGWATADANEAVGSGTLLTYLDGLADAGIGCLAGGSFAPDCKTKGLDPTDNNNTFANNSSGTHTPEALVISFDTSGLAPSTTLTLQSIKKALWTAGDRIDVAVYDASEDTVTTWLMTAGSGFLDNSNTVVETGDLVIIGVSTDQGNEKWRIDNLTFEVDSLLSPYGAKNPDPAGPLKVIPTSPADVTLSWDGSDDPNTTVDNFDIYVGINEPNLALVTPIDKDLGMSHVVSGLVEGDVVTWRVDSTVTFDSAEIMGEPLTQVIEGFPWSFTVSEDGPVTAVDWDNNPNTIASWPGAVAPMSVTVTDTGSSAVSYTYSATEPNLLFDDGVTVANPLTTSSSAVGVSIDWNPGGTHTLTVEAHDAANPLDVATATTQIRFFDDACNATRSGLGADLAGDYPGDIALDAELYPNSRCVIDLQDIALLVADWLADYANDAPFEIIPAE